MQDLGDGKSTHVGNVTISDELFARINVSISLIGYVGCAMDLGTDLKLEGFTDGFDLTKAIDHHDYDVRGFVGYFPQDGHIHYAFGGSIGAIPKYNDSEAYDVWPECDCIVNKQRSEISEAYYPELLAEVLRLREIYPGAEVRGHGYSFGAC